MTLSTTNNTSIYTGNGVTLAFSFPYLFYANGDLVVKVAGVTKTINTDYTVTGAENPAGGTVTFLSAPANGAAVIIQRVVPYKQETDFENFDGNPADVTEKQFDLVVMQSQQLAEAFTRTISAPVGTSLTTNTITGTIDGTARALVITSSGVATSLLTAFGDDLNVSLAAEATGDLLMYDGAQWVNTKTLTGGSYAIAGTSSAAASLSLAEDTDNGTNTVTLIAPASIASNRTLTLPDASGTVALTNADAADFTSGAATDGQVLTADGAGGAAWETLNVSSGWVPIKTVTASNVTSVDFVNGSGGVVLDGTYKVYAVVYSNVAPATDNQDLNVRTGNDGSFDSGAPDYYHYYFTPAGGGAGGTLSRIAINPGAGSDTNENCSGVLYIHQPANTALETVFVGSGTYLNTVNNQILINFGGRRFENAAHDRVQFYFSSGNIASGTFTLYGIKDA